MALDESRKGRLAPGADADIVLLDQDLSIISTIVGGEVVYDPTGALVPLAHEGALPEVPVPDVAAP
jgi:adenine deaminase